MLTSKALLDTGSPRSFMSVSILSQLSSNIEFILTPLSAIDSHYQNPDGTSLDIIGRARIPIQLNNLSDIIAADFLVSRTLKTSIILGRDFLELAGISLYMDYQKPEIYRKYKQSVNHFKDPVKTLTMVDGHLVGSVTEYRDCTDMCDGARKSKDVADIEVYEEPETDDNIVKIENDLSQVKDDRIRKMLMELSSITTSELSSTPCAVTEHHIELIDGAKPYKRAYYRVNPKERQFIDEQIVKLLELGIIAPSRSSWGSPIVLVKKHDGSFRMCIDFRKLNEATKPELQPLPFFEDTFDRMSGMKIFTTLDLKSGYWQVALDKESRQLTAFICHRGLYEWRRMPMGLRNATATFQRLMKQVLAGLEHFTEVHVDDIIIFSKNYEEHLQHVHSVLERMYLMFGRENALFKDYRGQNMLVDDNEFVEQIEDRVKHIHGLVDVLHPQLISELNERRAHADIVLARTPGVPVGTLVQLRRMTKSDKLTRRYQGLYKIVSRTSEGNYALESIRGRPLPTPVHPTRIRVITPAIANDLLTHPEGRDENEDDDSENTFEVEEIRNHRQRRVGRNVVLEYEIKWVGFPETTWEAETNVYADELVAKYWDKLHAETHVNFIEEIREQQLLDKLSDSLRYYPSAALQKWICYQTGMLELDVSPSTHVLSFCTARLNKPLDHNDQLFLKSKSIWLDLQWSLEPLFISWICNHCRGKTIHSLLPEWLSLPKGCLLLNTLQLPSNIVWFTHADGTPSTRIPTPSWHCSLISFVVM